MRRSKKVDRVSKLPDEIRSHILSLMPIKFAVKTSVLSRKWRYTWTFVTNLHFENTQFRGSHDLVKVVDWVLESCKTSKINLFRIGLSYDVYAPMPIMPKWIDKAVRLNVRELHITTGMCMYQLPISLFTCNTLTKLTINFARFHCGTGHFPYSANLPSLKILEIGDCHDPSVYAFKLISGCPILESLSLKLSTHCDCGEYKEHIFNIHTLKRLKLIFQKDVRRVVLNVSKLEYLFVGGRVFSDYVVEDVSSLVEVSISFSVLPSFNKYSNRHSELLKGVNGVKSLSLEYMPTILLLPDFPNLKRLELKSLQRCEQIFQLLKCCPELKHLYIEKCTDIGLIEPNSVPACMLANLTTIKISICRWWRCDTDLMKYLLGNAKVLTKMTITWNDTTVEEEKKEARVQAQLLKLTRASKCCEIQFLRSLSHSITS